MVDNFIQSLEEFDESSAEPEELNFELPLDFSSERLDKVLATLLPEHSRGRLQHWITEGWVKVNGQETKVRQVVRAGDRIWVQPQPSQEQSAFKAEAIDLEIVAATEHFIIVNKAAGMVTHPGAGNWSGTLLNGLLYHFPELTQIPRAGIVHRLDKDTSGLLMVARTEIAQTHLVRQLLGLIDAAIGRDRRVAVRMSTDAPIAAKEARTRYRCLARGQWQSHPISLVECRLETGRTHQIRVHLSSLGHPLIGDGIYGGPTWVDVTRQMLHAQSLSFIDPADGSEQQFTAPLPEDLQSVVDTIDWL